MNMLVSSLFLMSAHLFRNPESKLTNWTFNGKIDHIHLLGVFFLDSKNSKISTFVQMNARLSTILLSYYDKILLGTYRLEHNMFC